MEEVTWGFILTLVEWVTQYKAELNRKTNSPGEEQAKNIHLNKLAKKIKWKKEGLDRIINSKVLFVELESPNGRIRRVIPNMTKESFNQLSTISGTYHGYKILSVTEIDPKTYEERV